MPIVINELVFKGRVQEPAGERGPKAREEEARSPADFEDVVEACVEEVMRALRRRKER